MILFLTDAFYRAGRERPQNLATSDDDAGRERGTTILEFNRAADLLERVGAVGAGHRPSALQGVQRSCGHLANGAEEKQEEDRRTHNPFEHHRLQLSLPFRLVLATYLTSQYEIKARKPARPTNIPKPLEYYNTRP